MSGGSGMLESGRALTRYDRAMKQPLRVTNLLMVVIKAVLITAAILYLGSYFGLRVREAGGSAAETISASR